MFFLDGGILPHQRSGRLGHLDGLRRIITKRAVVLLPHFAYAIGKVLHQIAVDCSSLPVCSFPMELRKDPITRSWVITGDDPADIPSRPEAACRFCDGSTTPLQVIAKSPNAPGVPWSARAVVHPKPLYRIEGEPDR